MTETTTEYPLPSFSHRAYGVDVECFGEDGGMVARGHAPDLRFIAACNHYARKVIGLRNIWDSPVATLEDALSIVTHVWAVPADPARYGGDPDLWAVRYDSTITEQTPGAFPLTVLLP